MDMENERQSDSSTTPLESSALSSTSLIFKKFQKLYVKQLKETDDSSDGLKLKVKILENWVEDLTEQNLMLVKTVDELECEALKRLSLLETTMNQSQESYSECRPGKVTCQSKGLSCQAEAMCRELEEMKKLLTDKEKVITDYQKRIEELSTAVEGEKGDDCSKRFANLCDQDRNVQPSVYRDLETTRLQLNQVEKEVIQLKKKLKEAETNMKRLRSDLVASEKNAREMRAALTAEVAEKHDQILALRREVNQLEEQLRQADMQTHFKDDIIKELRKEVKVARSKLEYLGIYPTINPEKIKVIKPPPIPAHPAPEKLNRSKDDDLIGSLIDVSKEVDSIIKAHECSVKASSAQYVNKGTSTSPVRENKSEPFAKKCRRKKEIPHRHYVGRQVIEISRDSNPELILERTEETLVEVLGIKERSLSHLEHLTEQLQQKDQVISCLKQQLTQGSTDLLYRVRQQVDWFTENVSQQLNKGSCSEEFKKCITTMLEELKESIECFNLGPSEAADISKDSIRNVRSLQKSLEKSKKDLCHSWDSISDTVHQMNKMDLSPLVDQWKNGLCKQKSLHLELQEIVRSIINITTSSNGNVECLTKSMDSLQTLLLKFTDELNSQPCGRSFTGWLKNLHCVVTELISKIQEITQVITDIRNSDDETHSDLVCKMQLVDSLQWDLNETLCTELKAYENLCRKEKAQKVKIDSLLATVLHHQELWNQQISLTDDVMREILRLSTNFRGNTPLRDNKQETQGPNEDRSTHLQNLVSKISADIRKSLCDIEQRQNQVSHLELDLSSVMLVLESAQQEIEEISKTSNTQDVRRRMNILLCKLKKQISNALTKANNLVNTYASTKKEFINSSAGILQLQKEMEVLEQEIRSQWVQVFKDFQKPNKKSCPCPDRELLTTSEKNSLKSTQKTKNRPCPNQEILTTCEQKVKKINETLDSYFLQRQNNEGLDKPLQKQYKCLQKALQKEDEAIQKVKGNVMELKSNLKDRDKLTETQEKKIMILENSLKRCDNEIGELCKTIKCLEKQKCEIESECRRKIQEMEYKNLKLQNCLKKHEDGYDLRDDDLVERLQNATVELASLAGNLHEDYKSAHVKITELCDQLSLQEKKSQKTEEALKIVISNLKESLCKEQMKLCDLQSKNKMLEKQLENCLTSVKQEQDQTVVSLQNSLQSSQKEVEKLCQKIKCLELKKAEAEKEYKEQIQKLQVQICELQNNIKKMSEESSVCVEDSSLRNLQNANLELAILAGHLQEDYRSAENKLSELYQRMRDIESKHHKSEAALQLVIANLKEVICKEKKKSCELEKENSSLQEQVKELEDSSKNVTKSNQETLDKICDLKKQVKCWSKQASELEDQVKNIKEKLCKSLYREKELETELLSKETKCKEELCKKQKEINELAKLVKTLTERVNSSKTELDSTKMKTCEAELKLKEICKAYEDLKLKEIESSAHTEKLQVALTQLSNKFVSRRLDTGAQCMRHYQEECAKYEALYNTTACKLRSKEVEISTLKQEMERLRSDLDHAALAAANQKDDMSCQFLMEKVHQLSKELQIAHSCQNSYESMIKDLREKNAKKEEENCLLKAQLKQTSFQRDSALSDLEEARQEINRLRISNSNLESTVKRLEQNHAHVSEKLHKAVYDGEHPAATHLQPNIELQREISTALTSQLRGVKQKLHATKHDYKLLQAAYEELNRKYTMLQRGERDLEEQIKEIVPGGKAAPKKCRPCVAKSSKSVTYIKMPEGMAGQSHMEYLSHSKSWHKMDNNNDADWKEKRWKRRLQEMCRGAYDPMETMQHSSSSN